MCANKECVFDYVHGVLPRHENNILQHIVFVDEPFPPTTWIFVLGVCLQRESRMGEVCLWTFVTSQYAQDLTAEPWWDKNKFPWVQKLEAAYPLILAELKIMMGSSEDSELTLGR